jgi:hypothetical protein
MLELLQLKITKIKVAKWGTTKKYLKKTKLGLGLNLSVITNSQERIKGLRYIFFGLPHLATFILFLFIDFVIASITYIHPVYGGIGTHDLLDVSLLP